MVTVCGLALHLSHLCLISHLFKLSLAIPLEYVKGMPTKAVEETGMPCSALSLYSWPHSISWCLADGYRNGDHRRPVGSCDVEKGFTFFERENVCR